MKYAVKIVETLERTVIVDAEDFNDAAQKVCDAYHERGSEIILDADDFSEVDFVESATFGKNPIAEDDERLELFTKL